MKIINKKGLLSRIEKIYKKMFKIVGGGAVEFNELKSIDGIGFKSVEEIKSALERDNFMTADVAQSFGLIDEVVEKRS